MQRRTALRRILNFAQKFILGTSSVYLVGKFSSKHGSVTAGAKTLILGGGCFPAACLPNGSYSKYPGNTCSPGVPSGSSEACGHYGDMSGFPFIPSVGPCPTGESAQRSCICDCF